MPIEDSNTFSAVGVKKSNDKLVILNTTNTNNNILYHSTSNNDNVDTLSIKNILNKEGDLNICTYSENTIQPIIQVDNTHQHVNINSNLNIFSNLNVIENINVKNINIASNLNIEYIKLNKEYTQQKPYLELGGINTTSDNSFLDKEYDVLKIHSPYLSYPGAEYSWRLSTEDFTSSQRLSFKFNTNLDTGGDGGYLVNPLTLTNQGNTEMQGNIILLKKNISGNAASHQRKIMFKRDSDTNELANIQFGDGTHGNLYIQNKNGGNIVLDSSTVDTEQGRVLCRHIRIGDDYHTSGVQGVYNGYESEKLYVTGNTKLDGDLVVSNKIGINTSTPIAPLHIYDTGDTATNDTTNNTLLRLESSTTVDSAITDYNPISIDFVMHQYNKEYDNCDPMSRISSVISGGGSEADETSTDLLFSTTNNKDIYERMRITNTGNVGIGYIDPPLPLSVHGGVELAFDSTKTSNSKGGLYLRSGWAYRVSCAVSYGPLSYSGYSPSDTSKTLIVETYVAISADSSNNNRYYWWQQNSTGFTTNYTGGYARLNLGSTSTITLSFTGQHRCVPLNIDYYNNVENYIGYIVCATGKYKTYIYDKDILETKKNAITVNDSLPIVELSNKKKQKSIFGIISNKEEENRVCASGAFETPISNKNDEKRIYINSIGEGALWIVNTNGNLENGDYIQSSDVIGMGEKQDDDFLHSYTVAKITCDCDFILNSEDYNCIEFIDSVSGNTYRKAFVGCTYHCG